MITLRWSSILRSDNPRPRLINIVHIALVNFIVIIVARTLKTREEENGHQKVEASYSGRERKGQKALEGSLENGQRRQKGIYQPCKGRRIPEKGRPGLGGLRPQSPTHGSL